MIENKIDFIITWVDESDEDWKKEKEYYSPETKDNSNNKARYRNWDTLRYWFRGEEQFAPWVNKIHFVTWGHTPEWLNLKHPKLNIVKHKDYIPEKYLPTFNSRVIELNFHRINNLSNQFVYFNDDMFLLNKVTKKDFFKDNKPCDSLIFQVISPYKDTYNSTLFNNMAIINKYFNKREVLKNNLFKIFNLKYSFNLTRTILALPWGGIVGIYNPHLSVSYLKRTFHKLWDKEAEILNKTCYNKFRSYNDINHFLIRYWQLVTGDFVPCGIKGEYFNVMQNNEFIIKNILDSRKKMICINDGEINGNYKGKKSRLIDAFKNKFSDISSYELTNTI